MVLTVGVLGTGEAFGAAKGTDRPINGSGSGSGTVTVEVVDGALEVRFVLDGTERMSHLGRTTTSWQGRCTNPPACTDPATGTTTRVAANGDTLTTVWTAVGSDELGLFTTETISGGTGRFAGASGTLMTISRDVFDPANPLAFTTTW